MHSPDALQDVSPLRLEAVHSEVRRQRQIISQWRADATLPHHSRVQRLLSDLPRASRERQERIFRELEALGPAAVRAMVAQLDDRRPLAYGQISLTNHSPDAFEGIRHYGPQLVVDALDAILNQITGFGGSIVNGGSERERRHAVEMWRVYAADMACGAA